MIGGDVINIMTLLVVYFADQILKNKFWSVNYTPDEDNHHLLLSKPVAGISFNLWPFWSIKCIKIRLLKKMKPFFSINCGELS